MKPTNGLLMNEWLFLNDFVKRQKICVVLLRFFLHKPFLSFQKSLHWNKSLIFIGEIRKSNFGILWDVVAWFCQQENICLLLLFYSLLISKGIFVSFFFKKNCQNIYLIFLFSFNNNLEDFILFGKLNFLVF